MKFLAFRQDGVEGLAVVDALGVVRGRLRADPAYPGALDGLIGEGPAAVATAGAGLAAAPQIDPETLVCLPPLSSPGKIICVGQNYYDHRKEMGADQPADYPTLFVRFASSLVGHGTAIVRPKASEKLDYEGEMVAVIGRGGRHIAKADALAHVAGYSVFNDGSIRDYQRRTSQWTVGKNFDATGGFGPYFVTADLLPPGASGLRLETRLNGAVVQQASTADMIFDVASLIERLSEVMTLSAGDVIVTGTPGGVGMARTPPLWMKPGDVCEVEIEGVGLLRNPIAGES